MRTTMAAILAASCAIGAIAAPPVSPATLGRISDEGFNHSEVAETAAYLTDRIGGRLTNSPGMRAAEAWTQERYRAWGLANVHKEGFVFGRGWSTEAIAVRMVTPRPLTLRAFPLAWTPATPGPVTAPVIVATMRRERDFALWKGKLAGKIVMYSYPADPKDATDPAFKRLDDAAIKKLDEVQQPSFDPSAIDRTIVRRKFAAAMDAFVKAEGGVALVKMASRDSGLLTAQGSGFEVGKTPTLPTIELVAEDYRRLARLAKTGPVTIEIDSRTKFDDSDVNAYNIFAEIPGSDPKAGYVMAGAHLDSWTTSDGAADNAAGSAMIMEAARILAKTGAKPKRTIRFVLWSGEEQGLLGSNAFVDTHIASRARDPDPAKAELNSFTHPTYPITPKPGFKDLIAYFNIDNGGGKLRGLYAEGNYGVIPIFKEWLTPLAGLGAGAVVAQNTGSTDHVGLQRLGLPAFQFIQDPLDYETTVHHTSVDSFDHLRIEDLRQGSVVLATVLLDAADAEQPLPRKPLPTQPKASNPFKYNDPNDE